MRAFNCIGQRTRQFCFESSAPISCNSLGHLPDQDCRSNFPLHEAAQRLERKSFIFAAGDQYDWLTLREQGFLERVEIGRLGIINVIDAFDLPNKFAAMRPRLVGAKSFVSARRSTGLFS